MMVGKLSNLCSVLGNYRSLLINRITASTIYQQQNAGLKSKAQDKLKNLNIPEPPKKPLTAYFRFLIERRNQIQKQDPNLKLTEVTKKCAEEWKNVSNEIKDKYVQDYLDEMKIYGSQHQHYIQSLSKEQVEGLRLAQKEKREKRKKRLLRQRYRETGKPKRPISSFILFIQEKQALPENKGKKLSELLSMYSNEWKTMTDEQKQKYINTQNDAKEHYKQQMAAWEAKMIKEGHVDIIRKDSMITTSVEPLRLENVKQKKTTAKSRTNKSLQSENINEKKVTSKSSELGDADQRKIR